MDQGDSTGSSPSAFGIEWEKASVSSYEESFPLGGVLPEAPVENRRRSRRHLVLAVLLFLLAIVAARSSMLPWRDYRWDSPDRIVETGWTRTDDVLGRGWVTMGLSIAVVIAGLLIAAWSERLGRVIAVVSGVSLMILATAEWGLGNGATRDGPGTGLWLQLAAGVGVVLAVGIIKPSDDR